ncbi:DUF4435 domain-containing protein [Pseudomonas sp. RL_5y_Pfl2_70]|uniref:DUF4435 domain-containing protein n=1 Tax=Pseudomonas sp. RL_5y_Pfl2_70 TaxID=3088712 RepID=UPI0030D97C14
MTDLVASLRQARHIPQVALQQYMVLRSKALDDFVCVFEGQEDYPYYDTIFRKIRDDFSFKPLIVNGKDQVLGLRNLLLQRESPAEKKVAYFIDRDFDGYKNSQPSENIYCTDGYSIENNLCSVSILPPLLASEYLCHKYEEDDRIPLIVAVFRERLAEFSSLMRETNRIIYFARQNSIRLQGVENQITKYLDISLGSITSKEGSKLELLGWPEEVDPGIIPCEIPDFEQLHSIKDWRGKFVLGVFVELLHHLKNDRCSNAPSLFSRKSGMKFNPKGEIIRTLAILSPVPTCLRSFILKLGATASLDSTKVTA